MTQHPLADMIPIMIDKMGAEMALTWWMRHGIDWPGDEGLVYSQEAVRAMARGDEDFVIIDVNGDDLARAFQWVQLFSLEAFVEAERAAPAA